MPALPLIANPAAYRPNTIDMVRDAHARGYWLNVFENHTPGIARRAAESEDDTPEARQRAERYRRACLAELAAARDGTLDGDLSILTLCRLRQRLLEQHGFDDPFRRIKHEENEAALKLLPGILTELDRLSGRDRIRATIRNIFAGNIFDMGCSATVELYESGQADFLATRDKLPDRPWLVDDLDPMTNRLIARPPRKAMLFVDNAGADVVLGMIPLARLLLRSGAEVVLTANTGPALNDITHDELVPLIGHIAGMDDTIAAARNRGRLRLVGSGNNLPVIDLSEVSEELADAARGADLLVIEGMGRSLETNYDTAFTCDAVKLAMVKEQNVADLLGGRLYDVVCRFDPV